MQPLAMQQILRDILRGTKLHGGEALALTSAAGDELQALLETAAAIRDQHKGRTVTFSPKVFVPLTNLCRDFCGYCTFRKKPDQPGAKTRMFDEVLCAVKKGKRRGGPEVFSTPGDKPEAIYSEMKQFLA